MFGKVNSLKLHKIAPLTYWVSWGYVYLNVLVGLALISLPVKALPYVIVNQVFTPRFWGLLFIFVGVLGMSSLVLNRWKFIQHTLMFGLLLKALWFYAMIFQIKTSGIALISIWSFIAYIQLLTVIYFPEN